MGNQRLHSRERYYVRKNASGMAIQGSGIWSKRKPTGMGHWVDITEAVVHCCTSEPVGAFLIFQADATLDADSEITNISFPGFSWAGSVVAGDYLVIPLPYNFNETITVTALVTVADMDYTVSTVQGTGVIGTSGIVLADALPHVFTLTVDATPNSQYLCYLTNN